MTKHRSVVRGVIAPALLFALTGIQCNNAECESLRDELTRTKRAWSRCQTDADCIKTPGNSGDCTGIMSCDFAVNKRSREEAERRVASLPEETVDCMQCTSPNCVRGDITICEPQTKQCIIVTEILEPPGEGGAPNMAGEAGN